MTIDVNNSFGLEQFGVRLEDTNGDTQLYICTGTGDPTGSPAPINSWYFQQDTQQMWHKIGIGDNDWEEFSAAVAQSIELEVYSDDAVSSTTSDNYLDKLNITTTTKPAGDYLLIYSAQITNTTNNKVTGINVEWKENSSGTWIDIYEALKTIPRSDEYEIITGRKLISLPSAAQIDFRIQWGKTIAGGTGRIKDASLTLIKAEKVI